MNMTWTCPIELQECEGLALALCLRLRGSARKNEAGETMWTPLGKEKMEVVLTSELADEVVRHYAYLRHRIRCSPFVFKREHVAPLLIELVGTGEDAEAALDRWKVTHRDIVDRTRKDLDELVGAGFRCVG